MRSKREIRGMLHSVRALWNEFDPIGVMDDPTWPRDEYEAYCGHTLSLLERGASQQDIAEYVHFVVTETMGAHCNYSAAEAFGARLVQWFQKEKDEQGPG